MPGVVFWALYKSIRLTVLPYRLFTLIVACVILWAKINNDDDDGGGGDGGLARASDFVVDLDSSCTEHAQFIHT